MRSLRDRGPRHGSQPTRAFATADLLTAAVASAPRPFRFFPASRFVPSFHLRLRGSLTACSRWVFAVRSSVRPGPPFPVPSAFAAAAIPRNAMAAIPRGTVGGGRHPPDRVDGHHRRGLRRTASSAHAEAESGGRGPLRPPRTTTTALPADARAGAIGEVRRAGSARERRRALRPSAHRRADVERAEPVARRSPTHFGRSYGRPIQCFADELHLFTRLA
jgi:hypothetical protein